MSEKHGVEPRHPIRVVTRRTGLSPSVLRAWERRYGVVTPGRSEGGQRLYSDRDVHRLTLLVRVTEAGRSIGSVAPLSDDELEELVAEDAAVRPPTPLVRSAPGAGGSYVDDAMAATDALDANQLDKVLMRAAIALDPEALVDDVVLPLLQMIGTRWEHGRLGVANEHLASVSIRKFLEWVIETIELPGEAPVLVCATPQGQRHELGALLSGVVAAGMAWRAVFLGADLPADEIASATRQLRASAVALSAIYPNNNSDLPRELSRVASLLPADTPLLVGGVGAEEHKDVVEGAGGVIVPDFPTLRMHLQRIALGVGTGSSPGL